MPTEEQQEQLSPEEMQLLEEAMKAYGAPQEDPKHNVHVFLNNVAISKDTTKTGNLSSEELGFTRYSERSYKEMALISKDLCANDTWNKHFKERSEILTSTSLSKDGFLVKQATTQTKQIADITEKPRKENSGWFKPKNNNAGGGS